MWKPIKGYEGLYEVSESGVVRSVDRYIKTDIKHVTERLQKGRILKQNLKPNGYRTVDLCKEGKVKTTLVHRIVATTFIDNPEGKRYINHKDSNRQNNSVDNLEWVTSSENRMHGINQGNVSFSQCRAVECIDNGLVFQSTTDAGRWVQEQGIAKDYKTALGNIKRSCKTGMTAYGFKWKYYEGSTTISKESTPKRVEMGDSR